MTDYCKGSWALGSACGKCQRCVETRPSATELARLMGYRQPSNRSFVGTADDGWQPDERTVRACIETLPYPGSNEAYRAALEALLPNAGKNLVRQFSDAQQYAGLTALTWDAGCDTVLEAFADWLASTGRLKVAPP